MGILGIDAGGSAVKLVTITDGKIGFSHYEQNGGTPLSELIPPHTKRLALTGVGVERCGARELAIPAVDIPELQAIGRGGTYLSNRDRALILSIGTGTAFILADHGKYTHLGGSGLGGGTLFGLSERLFGTRDPNKLDALARNGDESNVDLTIGDLFSGSETLDPKLTASNLAKKNSDATEADWAAGIVNLVLQALGTMAILTCGGHKLDCVVITGAAVRFSAVHAVYRKFQDIYGIEFIIPPLAEFSTAAGAVLIAGEL